MPLPAAPVCPAHCLWLQQRLKWPRGARPKCVAFTNFLGSYMHLSVIIAFHFSYATSCKQCNDVMPRSVFSRVRHERLCLLTFFQSEGDLPVDSVPHWLQSNLRWSNRADNLNHCHTTADLTKKKRFSAFYTWVEHDSSPRITNSR